MIPQYNHQEKLIASTSTIDEKQQLKVPYVSEILVNNIEIEKFNEIHSNQQNSNEIESVKGSWTYADEIKLYQLHDQFGNKWSMIAEHFQKRQISPISRNDNSVKNHFYSRLRKSLRRLNKIVSMEFKKSMKEIKNNVIYKIIEATEQKHKKTTLEQVSIEVIQYCRDLKRRLLEFSYDQAQNDGQMDFLQVGKKLIHDLVSFNREYRRKSKKTTNEMFEAASAQKMKKYKQLKLQANLKMKNVSECNLFESELNPLEINNSIAKQVLTRRRAKSGDYELMRPQVLRNSSPTVGSTNTMFKQYYESFFKQSGLLQENLVHLPDMANREPNDVVRVNRITQEPAEFEYFTEQEDYQQKFEDHFDDPQLHVGNFSLFK